MACFLPIFSLLSACIFAQGDASELEVAAEKMTSAVALLVQMEREIIELTESGVGYSFH